MRFLTALSGLAVALTTLAGLSADARACSPPLPELYSSMPKSGDTYPANGALFFDGYGISLDAVSVTVDGQPAALVGAPDLDGLGLATLVARVEPTPASGQTVQIEGSFCPEAGCEVKTITFTAAKEDSAPPAAPGGMSFDIHDFTDFVSSGGDCQSDTDLAWWIDVEVAPPDAADSPVVVLVQAFRDDSYQDVVFSESTFVVGGPTTGLRARRTVSVLDGKPAPEAFCFRALVKDAAGNASIQPAYACKPCRYRNDDTGMADATDSFPPEPAWTDADVYPGGPCDEGAGGSGAGEGGAGGGGGGSGGAGAGDSIAVVGCGCRLPSGGAPGSGTALFTLLAATALLRRRRRG